MIPLLSAYRSPSQISEPNVKVDKSKFPLGEKWINPDRKYICVCGHSMPDHMDRVFSPCSKIGSNGNLVLCDKMCAGFRLSHQLTEIDGVEPEPDKAQVAP